MKILEFFEKYQKFIIFSAIFLSIVSFFGGTLAVAIILFIFLGTVSLFFIGKSKEHAKILGLLFLIAFAVHITATLFVFYTNFQPFSGGRGDFTEYATIAQEVSNRVHSGNFSLQGITLGHYYPVIVGYLYAMTTPSVLIGELFNAWLIALLVIAVYFIVLETGASKKEAFIVGLIANFYPSLSFFGSLLLKEPLAGLLCMIALLMMLKIIKEFSWWKFFLFYSSLLGVTHFRFYISNSIALAFIICWFLFSTFKIKKRLVYGIFMIAAIGFLPIISGGEGVGQQYFGINVIREYLTPGTIISSRETACYEGGCNGGVPQVEQYQVPVSEVKPSEATPELSVGSQSSVIIKTGLESPFTFIRNTIWSSISALLGPFPWQITKVQQLFILPEIVSWYLLLFFIIKGMVKSIKTQYKVIVPLALFSVIVFGVLGLFLNNYGITTRIRIPAVLSLLCLLPFGFPKLKNIKIPFINNLEKSNIL